MVNPNVANQNTNSLANNPNSPIINSNYANVVNSIGYSERPNTNRPNKNRPHPVQNVRKRERVLRFCLPEHAQGIEAKNSTQLTRC